MSDMEILKRLDTVISILRLAHASDIDVARTRILEDDTNRAILEATANDFIASGELKTNVANGTTQSEKTVQRRIVELVTIGALEKRPTGLAAYRATGLI